MQRQRHWGGILGAVCVGLSSCAPAGAQRTPPKAHARIKSVAGAICAPPQANNNTPPRNPIGWLKRTFKAQSRLSFVGRQRTLVNRARGPVRAEQAVSHAGDRAVRIDYISGPKAVSGEQIVDDGTTFWHYIPSRNTLETGPSRIRRQHNRVRQLINQIQQGTLGVSISGEANIAGNACTIVDVRPVSGFGPWRRLWIDHDTYLQLKVEEYRTDGSLLSESEFTQISIVNDIQQATFGAPVTPPNVIRKTAALPHSGSLKEAQKKISFPIRQPAYLPAGYTFQSAEVSRFRSSQMVILRYVNGLNTISVFQIPADAGEAAQGPNEPRPDVAVATVAGMKIVVIGTVGTDELQHVLSSIH